MNRTFKKTRIQILSFGITISLIIMTGCSVAGQILQFPEREVLKDATEAKTLELGRQFTEEFFSDNLELLWNNMTEDMREAAGGTVEEFREFRQKVFELAGDETEIIHEEFILEEEINVYRRTSLFNKMTGPVVVQWGFGLNHEISDFFIRPAELAASVVYQTKTVLHLPFDNEWYVTAGGRSVEQNHHSIDYSNRFAYDMVSAKEFEWPWPRNKNEDFATWGKPILAPAVGVVAMTLNDVPDNKPGDINVNKSFSIGNFVSIDHGNGEFSILGHLQMGSVRVAVGDTVLPGDVVGLAGNSGNSNGPHLHYNLQDRPEPNRAKGLPAKFTNILVDDHHFERFEPVMGQRISSGSNQESIDEVHPFDYHQRLIFVDMSINGTPDLLFLFDTGANKSAIDVEIVERLSLPVLEKDSVEGSFGTIAASLVEIDSVSIGTSTVKNLNFTTYDLSGLLAPPGKQVHGILGTDFMKHFSVTIDFRNKELSLSRTSPEESQSSIPIELDKDIPRVKAVINDCVETYFRYDSGSSLFETDDIYLNTTTPIFEKVLVHFPELEPVTHFSASGLGGTVRLPVYRVSSIKIDNIVIDEPYLIVQPEQGYFAREDAVGFFGNNLLEKYEVITIDFIGKRLYLRDSE